MREHCRCRNRQVSCQAAIKLSSTDVRVAENRTVPWLSITKTERPVLFKITAEIKAACMRGSNEEAQRSITTPSPAASPKQQPFLFTLLSAIGAIASHLKRHRNPRLNPRHRVPRTPLAISYQASMGPQSCATRPPATLPVLNVRRLNFARG